VYIKSVHRFEDGSREWLACSLTENHYSLTDCQRPGLKALE
jgi:hypothetical protein